MHTGIKQLNEWMTDTESQAADFKSGKLKISKERMIQVLMD